MYEIEQRLVGQPDPGAGRKPFKTSRAAKIAEARNKRAERTELTQDWAVDATPPHLPIHITDLPGRSRLKVLWTAACMLRKRWADRADLNRCSLRSRRRTA
jgi:hypothetical protein